MDKIITTVMLIVISMMMALSLFNTAYPAVIEGADAISNMVSRSEDRLRTEIVIIHTAGELDSNGVWQDTNDDNDFNAFLWVKNTGSTTLNVIAQTDLFFGPETDFGRIPNQATAGGIYPYWTGDVEGGGSWVPGATLRITIHYTLPLSSGRYFARVTLPNAVSASIVLGL
ncbi:MAG: hypothetical protein U0528_05805 [Anaerolineae bacterium]|nr:hypothetical protein [Anaerolineae bacterium]